MPDATVTLGDDIAPSKCLETPEAGPSLPPTSTQKGGEDRKVGISSSTPVPVGISRSQLWFQSTLDAFLRPFSDTYGAQLILAAWMLITMLYFFVCRLLAYEGHLPYDGDKFWRSGATCEALLACCRFNLIALVLTGATQPARFTYIVYTQRYLFFSFYILTGLTLGASSNIPFLKHSWSSYGEWTWPTFVVMSLLMCAILGIIGYHIVMARRLKKTNHDYRLYLARNVVALSFYVFMTVVVLADGLGGNVHFHHYSAGVLLALWCELDTPTSVIGKIRET